MPSKRKSTTLTEEPKAKRSSVQTTLFAPGVKPTVSTNWFVSSSLLVYTPENCKPSSKILAFDMDNTLIRTASGKTFPQSANDWVLLNDKVQGKLKDYHNKGFKLVIISNQHGVAKGHVTVADLQKKIENIVAKIGIPVQGLFSLVTDRNRKPMIGMWEELERSHNGGVSINRNDSFYCGDAAGRPPGGRRPKKDFSCSDRLFAMNVGVPFLTPEQLWYDEKDDGVFSMPKFDPNKFCDTPDAKFEKPKRPSSKEVIIMVGYPASGKSHFSKHYLEPLGYTLINRDVIGTWQKCVKLTEEALQRGESVVIDNTNMDVESRGRYIKAAKAAGATLRCFIMTTEPDHARHNERFRVLTDSSHTAVSQMVFNMLKSKYVEPKKSEGFDEVKQIPFILDRSMENFSLYCMHLLEK